MTRMRYVLPLTKFTRAPCPSLTRMLSGKAGKKFVLVVASMLCINEMLSLWYLQTEPVSVWRLLTSGL